MNLCALVLGDLLPSTVKHVHLGPFVRHLSSCTGALPQIDGGVEAVLVKVAAAGLSVAQDLGAPLAEMEEKLHALRR